MNYKTLFVVKGLRLMNIVFRENIKNGEQKSKEQLFSYLDHAQQKKPTKKTIFFKTTVLNFISDMALNP